MIVVVLLKSQIVCFTLFFSFVVWTSGSAAVSFMSLNGMESLLSHQYFKTESNTEMYSDILTAVLLPLKNAILTKPVSFTILHKVKHQLMILCLLCFTVHPTRKQYQIIVFVLVFQDVNESGTVTCVYWEDNAMQWSVNGCWITYSDENYTVCSCSHLSTFALIMQIGEVYSFFIYMAKCLAMLANGAMVVCPNALRHRLAKSCRCPDKDKVTDRKLG